MARSQIEMEEDRKNGKQQSLAMSGVRYEDSAPVVAQSLTPLDPDSLRALAKRKLVGLVETATKPSELLPAIRELLDRLDGKPITPIAAQIQNNLTKPVRELHSADIDILRRYHNLKNEGK